MKTSELLGFNPVDRLLLINADDFGMCQATNAGIASLIRSGMPVSTSIMMNCPWALDASRLGRQLSHSDVGVHLTMTSEWETYKWEPLNDVCRSASLRTEDGFFPADCQTFESQADPEEVKAEIDAQITKALAWGIAPTHLDNHMGSLFGLATGRHFVQILIEAAAKYGLPLRLPRSAGSFTDPALAELAESSVKFADHHGVLIPDDLLNWPYAPETASYAEAKNRLFVAFEQMSAGISELIMHPSAVNDELKAITPHWRWRGIEMGLLTDPDTWDKIKQEGIRVVRWSDLQAVQRRLA
ncbi:polysaccharide deacetylase family protein [Paenibacillus physcomitrellae]|uniref:Carbohydrate deacetylase n=1 Tax=Paenibacillus physcomitrellae TaxID=1619311 RepID=A0ABQ1GID6_9BACL|nr:polysaccharide deacetylase family protein [Paenibacillus physcomitrellae]GGA44248.1 carbohydrate deacetylase [Paenibacillus physcomitrellae]